jgi:hypothetical protein
MSESGYGRHPSAGIQTNPEKGSALYRRRLFIVSNGPKAGTSLMAGMGRNLPLDRQQPLIAELLPNTGQKSD